jgi:membrane protease YdiL (CAAX protease family)
MSGANKNPDVSGAIPAPVWFVAAMLPMVISQIARLQQTDASIWIACDYAGRVGALAVLAIIPAARTVAFQKFRLAISWWEVVAWALAVVLADRILDGVIWKAFGPALANTRIATYPVTTGWLYAVDIVFGLALVAASEEILFRRCARHVLQSHLGSGTAMVVASALLFGAYHWWTGIGNIISVTLIGVILMMFYMRSKALWPVVMAHYITNVIAFA